MRRDRAAPPLVLLLVLTLGALAASGCLGPTATAQPRRIETCLLHGHQAEWIEPGLAEALPDAARRAGLRVDTTTPPWWGFTLGPDARLRLPLGGEPAALTWHADPVRTHPSLSLMPTGEGEWQLRLSAAGTVERDRALLHAFLARVGLADRPELAAWEKEFFIHGDQPGSTDGPKGFREARIAATPSLDPLVTELLAHEDGQLLPMGLGAARWEADRWEMHLRLPTHGLRLGEGANALRLDWDALDHVRAHALAQDDTRAWETLQARVNASFQGLGLPPATFHEAAGGPAAC